MYRQKGDTHIERSLAPSWDEKDTRSRVGNTVDEKGNISCAMKATGHTASAQEERSLTTHDVIIRKGY